MKFLRAAFLYNTSVAGSECKLGNTFTEKLGKKMFEAGWFH